MLPLLLILVPGGQTDGDESRAENDPRARLAHRPRRGLQDCAEPAAGQVTEQGPQAVGTIRVCRADCDTQQGSIF